MLAWKFFPKTRELRKKEKPIYRFIDSIGLGAGDSSSRRASGTLASIRLAPADTRPRGLGHDGCEFRACGLCAGAPARDQLKQEELQGHEWGAQPGKNHHRKHNAPPARSITRLAAAAIALAGAVGNPMLLRHGLL